MDGITIKKKVRPGAAPAPPPQPPIPPTEGNKDAGISIKKRSRPSYPPAASPPVDGSQKRPRPDGEPAPPPFRPPPPAPPGAHAAPFSAPAQPLREREFTRKPRWTDDAPKAADPPPFRHPPPPNTEALAESYVALRAEATPRVLPAGFSVQDEQAAFDRWLALSKAEAKQALKPSEANRCDMEDLRDDYNRFLGTLRESGWTYDAQSRTYRPWSKKIEVRRAPFWFEYAPQREPGTDGRDPLLNVAVAADAPADSERRAADIRGDYALKIISTLTQKHPETVSVLSSRLLRRYHGEVARTAAVLALPIPADADQQTSLEVAGDVGSLGSVSGVSIERISVIAPAAAAGEPAEGGVVPMGKLVNDWISEACGASMDLLVIIRNVAAPSGGVGELAGEIQAKLDALLMDSFVPVYPVFLSPEVLVITPILLLQLNGCASNAPGSLHVFQSLFSRMRCMLGAYLHNPSNTEGIEEIEKSNYTVYDEDNSWYQSGLRSKEETLDGRFHVMQLGSNADGGATADTALPFGIRGDPSSRVDIASHVAWCQHGWCSVDTRVGLKTAITHYKPKVILELGSWYGKSSRFMLDFIEPGTVLFCADYYKNNAIYEHKHLEVAAEDKMFFNFPRYESFIAGIESKRDVWRDKSPCTVITVKMNIHEIIPYLHAKGVHIDMVFIDAEKKTDPLYRLVTDIHRRYPSAVIVGDDNVFQSVKTCVQRLIGDREEVISMEESYVALPRNAPDRHQVKSCMDMHREEIDIRNSCAKYISNLFNSVNEASIASLESFLFPNGADGSMVFENLAFVPDKDNGHCIAMQVISRAMKIIQKKNSPHIPKLTELVLRIVEKIPNAVMTEGRVTCFDFIARNIGFE